MRESKKEKRMASCYTNITNYLSDLLPVCSPDINRNNRLITINNEYKVDCWYVWKKKKNPTLTFLFTTLEVFIDAYHAYNARKWKWFSSFGFYNKNKSLMSTGRKYVTCLTSVSCCCADILYLWWFIVYDIEYV